MMYASAKYGGRFSTAVPEPTDDVVPLKLWACEPALPVAVSPQ